MPGLSDPLSLPSVQIFPGWFKQAPQSVWTLFDMEQTPETKDSGRKTTVLTGSPLRVVCTVSSTGTGSHPTNPGHRAMTHNDVNCAIGLTHEAMQICSPYQRELFHSDGEYHRRPHVRRYFTSSNILTQGTSALSAFE